MIAAKNYLLTKTVILRYPSKDFLEMGILRRLPPLVDGFFNHSKRASSKIDLQRQTS
jgi:hypothetical protein